MRKISVLLWVGLFVNILLVGVAWFCLNVTRDEYNYGDSYRLWSIVFPVFIVAIILQLASVILFFKVPKIGRFVAAIGSLIMLPIGMIFFMGYMSSYEKKRNASMTVFDIYDKEGLESLDIRLDFKTSPFFLNGVMFIVLGTGVMIMGMATGGVMLGAGVIAIINGFRLMERVVIGLSKNDLIITLGIFAETYRIPLSNVAITYMDNRVFKLRIKTADVDKQCTLRKAWLETKHVEIAMKDILPRLAVEEGK